MQMPHYAFALALSKVPTSTQLPGRENSRTAETNKIFPRGTCVGWHRDPHVEHTQWMPHSQIQAKPTPFWSSEPSFPNGVTFVKTRPQRHRRCVGRARGDRWEVSRIGGLQEGLLQAWRNDHRRASGLTHLSGASPTVVLCQGTNAMRVRTNTSFVLSYIGEPPPVQENTQSRALDTCN
jgi:hypothetical protein